MEKQESPFGPVIFAYTRADAIEDGNLVDVTETAKEYGIKFPVALTSAAWTKCVSVPEGLEDEQDERSRLWDVLTNLRHAIVSSRLSSSVLIFKVRVRGSKGMEIVELKSVCGPGDEMEPVITIMLPEED